MTINFLAYGKTSWPKRVPIPSPTLCRCATLAGEINLHYVERLLMEETHGYIPAFKVDEFDGEQNEGDDAASAQHDERTSELCRS